MGILETPGCVNEALIRVQNGIIVKMTKKNRIFKQNFGILHLTHGGSRGTQTKPKESGEVLGTLRGT